MFTFLADLRLTESATRIKGDNYELVSLRGNAFVLAGTLAFDTILYPDSADTPLHPFIDRVEWLNFTCSRFRSRESVDSAYETCVGLHLDTRLMVQLELTVRPGQSGRQILGFGITDVTILELPDLAAIQAQQKPQTLAQLRLAASNGRPPKQ